jgi:lysophospholipase L1-like esterase
MQRPEPTPSALPGFFGYFLAILASCQHEAPKPSPLLDAASAAVTAPARVTVPPASAPDEVAQAEVVTAASASASAAPRATPIGQVLVLGDSLSDERVGGGGFVKTLRERCRGATFDNRAKGGFMVNQMRKQLEKDVLPEGNHYSHAIVFGGVNDLYSDQTANRSLTRIEADLSRIYELLRERGVTLVAITVTPWGGFKRWYTPERGKNTLTLNGWLLERASKGDVSATVDAYPLLSCGDAEKLCPALAAPHQDGLHFGKLGHQKLAEALLSGPFQACR